MIREIKKFFIDNGMEAIEAGAEAELLVTEISGLSKEKILTGEEILNKDDIRKLAQKRVSTRAPIQHILERAFFMGDKFFVNPDVLIPRPETELLVRASVDIAAKILTVSPSYKLNILDIGTGSGCIACEISKNLTDKGFNDEIEIMGTDVSTGALRVAIRNMEALGQQRRVVFRKSDIFEGLRETDKFDIIVSNPPYIPILAKDTLQDEVKNFDPHLALFAPDDDGVSFYKRILEGAKAHLKPDTPFCKPKILFELGVNQAQIVSKLARDNGFKVEFIQKDLSKIERVICLSV